MSYDVIYIIGIALSLLCLCVIATLFEKHAVTIYLHHAIGISMLWPLFLVLAIVAGAVELIIRLVKYFNWD